jgi:GT2 family glycosyltransferase/glycosyltransferase involved in cell wall biosynthesis
MKWIWLRLPMSPTLRARLKHWLNPLLSRLDPPREPDASLPSATMTLTLKPTRLGGRDWIVLGIIGWSFRVQRPQHLCRALAAEGDRVFYIDPAFVNNARPGAHMESLDGSHNLFRVQLNLAGAPQIYFESPTQTHLAQLKAGLSDFLNHAGVDASVAVVEHAYWTALALAMPNTLVIYDCMDHHEGFGDVPESLLQLERQLIKEADNVVATSDWLASLIHKYGRTAQVVRNACDFVHFSGKCGKEKKSDKLVVGYFGAIADWFDVPLMDRLANDFPDINFVLIGHDTVQARSQLRKHAHIKWLGEMPYEELPRYLNQFDVCLLPFLKIPLTMATNPVKVYEYLAMGKHVVCVNLPEVSQFGDLVWVADTHERFSNAVRQALTTPPTPEQEASRQLFAKQQTWRDRAKALKEKIYFQKLPVISIVILAFNRWDLTAQCLASIFDHNDYPGEFEVIVSDNGSTDETPVQLALWATKDDRLKWVSNGANLGFSAGNNRGVAAARGEFLVILNNDTVVTRGWLLTMIRHFQRNPRLGLLGPVTNNIGNEARIEGINYSTLEDMPKAAKIYTLAHMAEVYPLRTAAFFCVMIPHSVWHSVGPLDENYGRGFFEDDDYCRRVEQAGWEVRCAEDVFVHHHLSATFNQVLPDEKRVLFEKNKQYYESKWGKWVPHSYR